MVLGLSMLAAGRSGMGPLYYFIYQAVVLNLVLALSLAAHNAANRRMADAMEGAPHVA